MAWKRSEYVMATKKLLHVIRVSAPGLGMSYLAFMNPKQWDCKHEQTKWKPFLMPSLSFEYLQCVDCGKILERRNISICDRAQT